MTHGAYRVGYVPWWRPIRLATRNAKGFDFIGWVWRQDAYQVKNVNYGWVAFLEDQTDEKLKACPCCKRLMMLQPKEQDSAE